MTEPSAGRYLRVVSARGFWGRRSNVKKASVIALSVLAALAAVALLIPTEEDRTGISFDTYDGDPDWSPNGRTIAFVTNRGPGGVYLIERDGTSMRRIVRGDVSGVDWSPDGKSIAFADERGIYVTRLRDGRPKLVLEGDKFHSPAFAPSGRALAVAKVEPDFSTAIYLLRLDGSAPTRLLPPHRGAVGLARPGSPAALTETEPAWSPDGKRIAFQAGDGEIVAAEVASGRRIKINEARYGYEPAWSPDGRLIAYQCEGDVCVANADGSGNEHVVAAEGGNPSWSPDSKLMVYEYYLYGGTFYGSDPQSLSIIDINGDNFRKLTYGPSP